MPLQSPCTRSTLLMLLAMVCCASAASAQVHTISATRSFIAVSNLTDFNFEACAAGDLNGDGYDDFALAAPGDAMSDLGRIWFYKGRNTASNNPETLYTFPGRPWTCTPIIGAGSGGDRIGIDLDYVGDINNDGLPDVIACAPFVCEYNQPTDQWSGRLYVIYGHNGPGTPGDPVKWACLDGIEQGQFAIGYAKLASWAGDANSDGYGDFLMLRNGGWSSSRWTELYHGAYVDLTSADMYGRVSWTISAPVRGYNYAYQNRHMANAGDVDGQGGDDHLVKRPENANPVILNQGEPTAFWCQFGLLGGMTGPAEMNGDAYSDLIIGNSSEAGSIGPIHVYFGRADFFTTPPTSPDYMVQTPGDNTGRWGGKVASLGDVNGDGLDDFAVADRGYDPGGVPQAGRVHVHSGNDGQELLRVIGEAEYVALGTRVSRVGDVDGDGYNDILISDNGVGNNPPRALIFRLSPDGDGDGIMDVYDNCPAFANPLQTDADNDGYGAAPPMITSCDCNDNNASINPETMWYADDDGDGFGDPSSPEGPQCLTPVGHVQNNTDCNDGSSSINPSTIWYWDGDQDGFGTTQFTAGPQCGSPAPIGFWAPGDATDCDDNNPSIGRLYWYADPEGDGFGDPAQSVSSCTQPPGYVANTTDNCPGHYNPDQLDGDVDGIGDACDPLEVTAYSPVDVIVISPSRSDSIGPGFNTFGSDASYDSSHDYGLGPNGVPGELDDRVLVNVPQPEVLLIRIIPELGADPDGYYYLSVRDPSGSCYGVRDPGGSVVHETYIGMTGNNAPYVSDVPVSNPVPEQGESASLPAAICAERRGDMNNDHVFDVVDVVGVIGVAFRAQSPPAMSFVADVNSDDLVSDVLDVVRLMAHVFRGQPPPGP